MAPGTRGTKVSSSGGMKVVGVMQQPLPNQPCPPPLEKPSFDVKDLRAAIPAHCFERSAVKGFMWVFHDLAIVAALGYAASWIDTAFVPVWARFALWPLYWYAQGVTMTGVWVLAHECGHQAFSDYAWLNDTVGWVLHSALLVPYFSWAISHGNHHKNTNSIEDDEVFVSPPRSKLTSALSESPLAVAGGIVGMLLVGWPLYLVTNVAGPEKYQDKRNSHFDSGAALWLDKQRMLVVLSNLGVLLAMGGLGYWAATYGLEHMVKFYFVPYLVVNMHLVLITFLQHTDTYVPHFRGESFNWLQGALCTVDRSFGPLVDYMTHNIADTHMCHHVFSKMPFYHAREATEAMRPVVGKYHLEDPTPITVALWNSFSRCKFVEDEGDIVWYQGPAQLNSKKEQ